ncbi:MAG: helix-turn-helix transcriptional regulator [Pseudoruegeria sp.]
MEKTLTSRTHAKLVQMLIDKRETEGITQTELAGRLGEYQSFVARLESGQRRIDVVEFIQLSRVLEFDATSFIEELIQGSS